VRFATPEAAWSRAWNRVAEWPWLARWGVKWLLLGAVSLLVLYPRLDLAWQQVRHFRAAEQLIEPTAPSLAPLEEELVRRLPANATPAQEVAAVEALVKQRLPYRYDWFNWGNLDYWPTVEEALARGQEDCDGHAIVAASLLRRRGYASAHLVGNFSHVWVALRPDDPKGGRETPRALLGPQAESNFAPGPTGQATRRVPSWSVLAGGLTEMSAFPAIRLLVLVLLTIVLVFHPCRYWPLLGTLLAVTVLAVLLVYDWSGRARLGRIGEASLTQLGIAAGLYAACLITAACAERRWPPDEPDDDIPF
jgi:hypothetical protein